MSFKHYIDIIYVLDCVLDLYRLQINRYDTHVCSMTGVEYECSPEVNFNHMLLCIFNNVNNLVSTQSLLY